jgi:hypothetical protein
MMKGFMMDNIVIVVAKPTSIFDTLLGANMVRLRQEMLENRNSNITTQLFCITCHSEAFMRRVVKAFSDFRLVAQIREEIEKVRPSIVSVSLF